MAEVATLLHWSLAAMNEMSVADLLMWHGRAVTIHNAMNSAPE